MRCVAAGDDVHGDAVPEREIQLSPRQLDGSGTTVESVQVSVSLGLKYRRPSSLRAGLSRNRPWRRSRDALRSRRERSRRQHAPAVHRLTTQPRNTDNSRTRAWPREHRQYFRAVAVGTHRDGSEHRRPVAGPSTGRTAPPAAADESNRDVLSGNEPRGLGEHVVSVADVRHAEMAGGRTRRAPSASARQGRLAEVSPTTFSTKTRRGGSGGGEETEEMEEGGARVVAVELFSFPREGLHGAQRPASRVRGRASRSAAVRCSMLRREGRRGRREVGGVHRVRHLGVIHGGGPRATTRAFGLERAVSAQRIIPLPE